MLRNGEFFALPAYPLDAVKDPTGAGDTFVGALAGYLATHSGAIGFAELRRAVVYGSVVASYNVEAFSLGRLRSLSREDIEGRYGMFRRMSHFEAID